VDAEDGGPFRYCPRCGCEYRQGFTVCSDCGVDLVDELPEPGSATPPPADLEALQSVVGSDPVAVLTTGSELQAALVRGLLIDAGIPAAVWASGFGAYFGHSSTGAGFGTRVMVHKEDEAEARALIVAADETPGR
jgi:hypothetical protein